VQAIKQGVVFSGGVLVLSRKLGEGQHGTVFKGQLQGGAMSKAVTVYG